MARPGPVKRLLAALESLRSLDRTGEPLEAVAVARRIREAAEDLERARVKEARERGVSWREIGLLYEMSKQAAQQRFGGRPPPAGTHPAGGGPSESRAERRAGKDHGPVIASRPRRSPVRGAADGVRAVRHDHRG
jgi:hypothetical protein